MCRNIRTLFNFAPQLTDEEVRAASLQFVRRISGFNRPSKANEAALVQLAQSARGCLSRGHSSRSPGQCKESRRGASPRNGSPSAEGRSTVRVRFAELVRRMVPQPGAERCHHEAWTRGGDPRPADGICQEVSGGNVDAGKQPHSRRARRPVARGQFLGGLLLRGRSALPSLRASRHACREGRQDQIAHADDDIRDIEEHYPGQSPSPRASPPARRPGPLRRFSGLPRFSIRSAGSRPF